MFTGIIEKLGQVQNIVKEGSNIHFTISCVFNDPLYIDQSIAHNGVCLTVVSIDKNAYIVTAIKETLDITNLTKLKIGDQINLERAVTGISRMDGHMVQGHVDKVIKCTKITKEDGSWYFTFSIPKGDAALIVNKGSICINGVSLTIVKPTNSEFKVAIIPYTYEHTNFQNIKVGDSINIEYDIIGKYVQRYMKISTQ
ncbi:MAG: riboflavin synthase [Saprospiraceae bacterium]